MLTHLAAGLSLWFVPLIGFDSPLETLLYLSPNMETDIFALMQTIFGSPSLAKEVPLTNRLFTF